VGPSRLDASQFLLVDGPIIDMTDRQPTFRWSAGTADRDVTGNEGWFAGDASPAPTESGA